MLKRITRTGFIIFVFCLPSFGQAESGGCPKIAFIFPPRMIMLGSPETLYATVGNRLADNYEYTWAVTKGEIVKGQGTSKIELLATKDLEGFNITVTVKVTGLPQGCEDSASDVISVMNNAIGEPLDRIGKIRSGELRARLDSFFIELQNHPQEEGLMVLYLEKNWSYQQKAAFVKLRYNQIVFRKIDKTRITFAVQVSGGYDEELTVLWLVPPGAEYPDSGDKNIRFIKAEDMEKELPKLFKKNSKK